MKKILSTLLSSIIIIFSFFSPFLVFAIAPSVNSITLINASQSGGKWSWTLEARTTDTQNGSHITITIKKGTAVVSTKIDTVMNNYFNYSTGSILDNQSNYTVTFDLSVVGGNSKSYTGKTGTAQITTYDPQINNPVITSFSPMTGVAGDKVTIVGKNFTGLTHVTFGTIEANISGALGSGGILTVPVPIGIVDSKITVETDKGKITSSDYFRLPVVPIMITSQTKTTTPNVYNLLAPIGSFTQAPDDIGSYFNTILKIAIGLCAVLAVIMIIIGGIQYMGDESIFGKTEAKSQITGAILGLLIALGSYAILNTINPDLLGKNGVNLKTLQTVIDNETETIPWEGYSNTGDTTACPEGFIDVLINGNKNNKINVCNSVADELTYMINAAQRAGIILSGSGTRSTAQQQALRVANGCADPALPSTSCNPQTARPGHSMHQAGKAIDFKCNGKQVTRSDACYQWLTINAAKTYGFYNLASEPWHWSTTGK